MIAIYTLITLTAFSLTLPVFGQSGGTPTTTTLTPNLGNLEFERQKAFIVVPPDELPVQYQQSSSSLDMNAVIGAVTGIVSGFTGGMYAKKASDKKAEQIEDKQEHIQSVQKEVVQTQVAQIQVQKEGLKLQYENMPNKGADITGKPEIKLENVQKLEQKAVETAAKT